MFRTAPTGASRNQRNNHGSKVISLQPGLSSQYWQKRCPCSRQHGKRNSIVMLRSESVATRQIGILQQGPSRRRRPTTATSPLSWWPSCLRHYHRRLAVFITPNHRHQYHNLLHVQACTHVCRPAWTHTLHVCAAVRWSVSVYMSACVHACSYARGWLSR